MSHTIPLARARHPMWVYEQNYALLHRLVPGVVSQAEDAVLLAEGDAQLRFTVQECCKYTLTVSISHNMNLQPAAAADLCLQVRIYRDVGVAEVMGYQGHWRFLPEYAYPNDKMFLPDEKRQTNFLLYELLCHFMAKGCRAVDLPDTADV